MNDALIIIGGRIITVQEALLWGAGLALFLLAVLVWLGARGARARAVEGAAAAERAREMDDKIAALNQLQAEMTGRIQTFTDVLGSRQSELARVVVDRLDAVKSNVGQGLAQSAEKTAENLQKLHERLAVIDAAQSNLAGLTSEVLGLKDILANKQARGAFGQGRMEAIVRDGLPASAFAFQYTLSNRSRPDCVINLPGDSRPLVIDAKFPLESFTALRDAASDEARAAAERRVRNDVGLHVRDIAEKYLLPGETQDLALLFVPSEALYADLCEKFEDVVQRAHKVRVLIVSPSLLMMAIQVMQAIVRDARMRDQARVIQTEVTRLLDDVRRLQERAGKLETHFRQAQEDVAGLMLSAEKVGKRGEKIEALDFEEQAATAATPVVRPVDPGVAAKLPLPSDILPSPLLRRANG
ncbi:MAG: DNA recombination protein RmuC [Proteobacteria bacterium]|nr:DNA recombination protein RmuC [Pseudomonadota bacterium]